MKKNIKKLLALVLALVSVFTLSVTAFAASGDIGLAEAKQNAVEAFGFTVDEVKFVQARKEADDGRYVYEIEFCKNYDAKYSCEVVASSGRVIDKDVDYSRNFFDKLELVFEILFAQLFGRV